MIELPDDELDKLFSKSSEELDTEYDPDGWKDLRSRLDASDQGGSPLPWYRRLPLAMLIGVVALLGGLVWVGTREAGEDNRNSTIELNTSTTAHGAEEKGSAIEAGKGEVAEYSSPMLKEGNVATATTEGSQAREGREKGLSLGTDSPKPKNRLKQPTRYTESRKFEVDGSNKARHLPNEDSFESLLTPKMGDRNLSGEGQESEVSEQRIGVANAQEQEPKQGGLEVLALADPTVHNPVKMQWPGVQKPDALGLEPARKPMVDSPKWAVKFGLSPDLGSVRFMKEAKMGRSVALLVEYGVAPRLYVQSGAVMSTKKYMAKHGDYTWPSNWGQAVMPMAVDGNCKIMEIPINLRYDLRSTRRHRWSLTAGGSSYHMGNEKYEYLYAQSDPSIKWYNWEGQTGWYWFSHLNASVGYEYRLNKSVSLMAEPNITVPIKKVGFGKVNLFTAGIWFSLRYTPKFR
ncbi:hypothetical protein CLV98_10997 [Dyadobacter jejuensis]|uniref:Outer membrane protein with beta-barrel domain n=1 Tax=Dyadobacter jejuensis TaxID=1082580 RepID=A0A316AI84_9BACT|nr:hypothetical protein [Dyadobacter jejuensis]PWJ56988.1 hypothetical protein CLV98_10997 [Dyadobacter jejuensis]